MSKKPTALPKHPGDASEVTELHCRLCRGVFGAASKIACINPDCPVPKAVRDREAEPKADKDAGESARPNAVASEDGRTMHYGQPRAPKRHRAR